MLVYGDKSSKNPYINLFITYSRFLYLIIVLKINLLNDIGYAFQFGFQYKIQEDFLERRS